MNLDQHLRAELGREADRQHAPAPDVESLIRGGRARRRRRTAARVGVAAAVAVLVGLGAYGVARIGSGGTAEPTTPSRAATPKTYEDTGGGTLAPGTYRMLVGVDGTGAEIHADVTFDDASWGADDYPVLYDTLGGAGSGGVAVYVPQGLSAGTGCLLSALNTNLADTPALLGDQLTELPQSTVLQSPGPVQMLGRPAVHVQLRIKNRCADVYRVAQTPYGGHGITYEPVRPVVIDFWVMDVRGASVIVETWHEVDVSSQMVDRLARTRDSITFVTGG
ncbi:hypothetical protein GCM10009798_06650 [Nocardioides panacihumi]|uniref:Uncharacterized protein n=1 Tax=Nocardioides panacihumi TaxID=400774 RepID=A0ABP5BPE9_9ACTN